MLVNFQDDLSSAKSKLIIEELSQSRIKHQSFRKMQALERRQTQKEDQKRESHFIISKNQVHKKFLQTMVESRSHNQTPDKSSPEERSSILRMPVLSNSRNQLGVSFKNRLSSSYNRKN